MASRSSFDGPRQLFHQRRDPQVTGFFRFFFFFEGNENSWTLIHWGFSHIFVARMHVLPASCFLWGGANIREIDASFCRSITNTTLKALPSLPALECLNLDGCQDVDDEATVGDERHEIGVLDI